MIKRNLLILLLLINLFIYKCQDQETPTESKDNNDLLVASLLKQAECGKGPNYYLFIASGSAIPAQKDVQVCTLSIIQAECPFDDYPLYCLYLFKNFEFKTPFNKKSSKDKTIWKN
ncbi:MAG: hypothetical protein H7A23_12650 [Leptospiraceae bacterium]|nr:hypothetical protein [Leptospiraceae bacterium]MCP5495399.1 hypothetical protein [Leptospiraceae bacterium]